ncbi:MAG: ADP-ribosylglycohydrolase family protein [Bacteroidota bacterium]
MKQFFHYLSILILCFSCQFEQPKQELMKVQQDAKYLQDLPFLKISRDELYDKILGNLVGSAIGDAMGAPTEMWSRRQIQLEYGLVDSLDNMVRAPSPEGTWDYNLTAGGTTDDTRWKVLLGEFYLQNTNNFYIEAGNHDHDFAAFLVDQYSSEIEKLKTTDSFDPAPFEQQMLRVSWLQEWAVVAKPYAEKDLELYINALSRFYGGEMVCAGLLYAPLLGVYYPGAPERAYESAYRLAIFDLGYAKDITALAAAMVAEAFSPEVSAKRMENVLRDIDPKNYFKSRLVGRISYNLFREALNITDQAKKVVDDSLKTAISADTLLHLQREKAFELLAKKSQDYPFHAGEIHLINLTALLFSGFDFREALTFVVNYGRDNDTVAAVTGAILGTYHGYDKIPDDMKLPVLKTNKEKLGIDLEDLANRITDQLIASNVVQVVSEQ